MMDKIHGILFDLGDTLLDFGRVDIRSLFEAGGRLAWDYLRAHDQPVPSFPRFHRRQLWAVRLHYLVSRVTRREFNALDVITGLSRGMGQRLSDEQIVELAWLWYKPLSERATVEVGLRDLLRELRDRGLKLGVISNTFIPGPALDRHLASHDLLDLLPVRVYSCDVRYRKPHPAIFRMGLERCQLQASQTLFVGDSLKADIAGANRSGLISVLKDPTDKVDASRIRPAHRIRQLAELKGVLDGCGADGARCCARS